MNVNAKILLVLLISLTISYIWTSFGFPILSTFFVYLLMCGWTIAILVGILSLFPKVKPEGGYRAVMRAIKRVYRR